MFHGLLFQDALGFYFEFKLDVFIFLNTFFLWFALSQEFLWFGHRALCFSECTFFMTLS